MYIVRLRSQIGAAVNASCASADSHLYLCSAVRAVHTNEIPFRFGLHYDHGAFPAVGDITEDVLIRKYTDIAADSLSSKACELFKCRIGYQAVIIFLEDPVILLSTVYPSLQKYRRKSKD